MPAAGRGRRRRNAIGAERSRGPTDNRLRDLRATRSGQQSKNMSGAGEPASNRGTGWSAHERSFAVACLAIPSSRGRETSVPMA
jgi:hypothetical protein